MAISPPPPSETAVAAASTPAVEVELPSPAGGPGGGAGAQPRYNPTTITLAAAVSAAAAAWMLAGMFRDPTAHLVALAGVAIGAGLMWFAQRSAGAAWAEYLVIPAAIVAGALLLAPDLGGSAGNSLPGLVSSALKNGGLLQPPVAFDPGWRFVLVVLLAPLTAGSAKLAISLARPKLAVVPPIVLALVTGIAQPASSEVASVAVASVLIVVALTLAYGAELGGTGQVTAAFEGRRLLRGGTVALLIAAAVLGMGNLGFLFPQPQQQHVIPPQKPPPPPKVPDHVVLTYTANTPVPLRMGVIDVYDASQHAWLLPPYDTSRYVRLDPPATIPQSTPGHDVRVTVTKVDGSSHQVPTIGQASRLSGPGDVFDFDPRTQELQLADRSAYDGLRYTLTAPAMPSGAQLAAAEAPPSSLSEFLSAPPPPAQVQRLLSQYAQQAASQHHAEDAWDRLVFLRSALYGKVVAAGAGDPVDVSAARVGRMLDGGDASPYEIAAAEALLARWAGIPARIGYGYYGGVHQKDGSFEVHPLNAALWLEVYFNRYGWLPIVGVPPRAAASTSQDQQNPVSIAAVDKLQLMVFIPVRNASVAQLFELLRWWTLRVLPIAAAAVLLACCYPWLLKRLRSRRRRRWAASLGPAAQIGVAYAEFRDRCRDLTVGEPAATPVAFLRYVASDREHSELAWLTERALWGDLKRDLRDEDAGAAMALSQSVTRRLDRAQPGINRVLARITRASLRAPYSDEVPNLWWEPRLGELGALLVRLRPRRGRRRRIAGAAAAAAALVAMSGVLVGVASQPQAHRGLPMTLVPSRLGGFTFKREPAAEALYRANDPAYMMDVGLVYSVSYNGGTEGAVQIGEFSPGIDISDIDDESKIQYCTDNPNECLGHEVLKGIQSNLGGVQFIRGYYKSYERAYVMALPDQRIYLWFPPGTQTMVTLVLLGQLPADSADLLFHALMDNEHNVAPAPIPAPSFTPPARSAPPSFGILQSPSPGGTP